MPDSAYLKQIEQKIHSLLSEKRLKESYNLCKSVLEQNPGNRVFEKLKKRIEEAIVHENEKLIERKLKEVKKLWKEEKYADILTILKELLRIDPENRKLKKEYDKVQKAYLKKTEELKSQFKERQSERLNKILDDFPDRLPNELITLEMNNPGNKTVQDLAKQFREKLISKKLNEKKELLKSDKYDVIQNFLEDLKKIEKENPMIKKMEKEVDRRKRDTMLEEKGEFVYGGSKHLDTLMKLKKYDKALQVAKEILAVDPNNKAANKILKKAERKLYSQTKNMSVDKILSEKENLKKEYQDNKENFIKI